MVTLLAVLIVMAVTLTITVTMLILGVGTAKTGIIVQKSWQTKSLANACAEEALQHLRDQNSYAGADRLEFETGYCEFAVQNTGSGAIVNAWGNTDGRIVRKVKVTIDTFNPVMNVARWQEVSEF